MSDKPWYISYSLKDGEYEEVNETIIRAKNRKLAEQQLKQNIKGIVDIDNIYQTTEDAML